MCPVYEYQCDACDHNFDIIQSYHASAKRKCPECKKWKLYRVIGVPYISIQQEPTSIGQLADRNTSAMGQYELQDKRKAQKEADREGDFRELPKGMSRMERKEYQPWWRKDKIDKKLNKLSKKDKQKYIMTGKKT